MPLLFLQTLNTSVLGFLIVIQDITLKDMKVSRGKLNLPLGGLCR